MWWIWTRYVSYLLIIATFRVEDKFQKQQEKRKTSLTGCSKSLEYKRFQDFLRPHFEFNSSSFNYFMPKEGSSGVVGEKRKHWGDRWKKEAKGL